MYLFLHAMRFSPLCDYMTGFCCTDVTSVILVKFYWFLLHYLYVLVPYTKQCSKVFKGIDSGARLPAMVSWLCHWPTVWPLASYLTPLGLGVLAHKVRIRSILPHVRTKWSKMCKVLKHCSIHCLLYVRYVNSSSVSSHDSNIWWPYHGYCCTLT